jgi:hypothetical protein
VNCRVCGTELPTGAIFCGECGSSVTATPVRRTVIADPRPRDTTIVEPLPFAVWSAPGLDTVVAGHTDDSAPPEELGEEPAEVAAEKREAEVVPAAEPVSFTFTLSSGGVETVAGSGLLGRRPALQPAEEVGVLIAFVDPGRSVSKTHLEFGIEGDNLWICDRYSANGTVLRAPGGVARLCEPGRRYRVTRESRIEIGEQYIDVR